MRFLGNFFYLLKLFVKIFRDGLNYIFVKNYIVIMKFLSSLWFKMIIRIIGFKGKSDGCRILSLNFFIDLFIVRLISFRRIVFVFVRFCYR